MFHHVCMIRDSKYITKDVKCYNSSSLLELSVAELKVNDSQEATQVAEKAAHELFCQFVEGKAQIQLDCIIKCMHENRGDSMDSDSNSD